MSRLASRKLWITVGTALLLELDKRWGTQLSRDPELVQGLLVGLYLLMQTLVDLVERYAGHSAGPALDQAAGHRTSQPGGRAPLAAGGMP